MSAPRRMTPQQIESFLAQPMNVMVAAIRRDRRPQMSPNWFFWDSRRFYISTTKSRRKYANVRREPRVQLAFDDPRGFKTVLVDGTTEVWEDLARGLPFFRAIREKHGMTGVDDAAHLQRLRAEDRVLLVITPDKPIDQWTRWGT